MDPPQLNELAGQAVNASFEIDSDATPIRYVAMGSVAASAMVLTFAIAAVYWFPLGGAMIAGLGCLLSVFGLSSPHRIKSAALLVIHAAIFLFCYSQTM
ncbi:hypothetical protein [Novipirellula aureliae]|uniref:hypothetical protein n=1 Tax=Novipirellula aureliae TaxID=2527966 RepID=UPI001E493803|nr:hypothetical protein [Novipirellula aureliae]